MVILIFVVTTNMYCKLVQIHKTDRPTIIWMLKAKKNTITMKLTKEICQWTLLCMWSAVLLSLLISRQARVPSSLLVSKSVTVVKLVEKRLFQFTCTVGPFHSPCIARTIIWSCSRPSSLRISIVVFVGSVVWTNIYKEGWEVFQSRHWTSLSYVSPNLNELQVMSLASGKIWSLYV